MVILGSSFIANRRTSLPVFDVDALSYISSVEAVDGQLLEDTVKNAINAFVIGCKSDGIWDAIKACCILAGARTLSGALTPLKGTSPTNFNFVGANYNRRTGLKGNNINKYIETNRANNADPQNDNHNAVFATQGTNFSSRIYISNGVAGSVGRNHIASINSINLSLASRSNFDTILSGQAAISGFKGISRSNSNDFISRSGGVSTVHSLNSQTPSVNTLKIFHNGGSNFSDLILSFYSIGTSLNLELLDNRITALMEAYTLIV